MTNMGSKSFFDKNTMTREYLIITNKIEIRDKLAELGRDNCILSEHDIPDDADIQRIKSEGKNGHFFLMYFSSAEQHFAVRKVIADHQISRATLMSNIFKLPFSEIEKYKDSGDFWDDDEYPSSNITLDRFLEIIAQIVDHIDHMAEGRGWIIHSDYHDRCGNCHAVLADDEKYCTMCGTKRGEGAFAHYDNKPDILYGSPVIMKWRCPKCGNVWVDWSYSERRYCKECGETGEYLKCDDPGGLNEVAEMTEEESQARMKRLLEE